MLIKILLSYLTILIICWILRWWWRDYPLNEEFINIKNPNYNLLDFLKDRGLHQFFKLGNDETLLHQLIFLQFFIILNVFRPLLFIFILLWFFYYLVLILNYKLNSNYYDIKVENWIYRVHKDISYLYLLYYLSMKLARWLGFVGAYTLCKSLSLKTLPKSNIKQTLNNLSFFLLLGLTSWNLFFIYKLSSDIFHHIKQQGLSSAIFQLPSLLIYNFENHFNVFCLVSKRLRIYKYGRTLYYNPKSNTIINTNEALTEFKKIISFTSKGVLIHPGISLVSYPRIDSNIDVSLQLTGKALKEHEYIKLLSPEYKTGYSQVLTNVVRDNYNLIPGYEHIGRDLGLDNDEGLSRLWTLVISKRLLSQKGVIIYEGSSSTDNQYYENSSFMKFIREKKDLVNPSIVRGYEIFEDRIFSLGQRDFNDLTEELANYGMIYDLRQNFPADTGLNMVNNCIFKDYKNIFL